MAYNLEEVCYYADSPIEAEEEKYRHIEQRQLQDAFTSTLVGSGLNEMNELIVALIALFGSLAIPGTSMIARRLDVRFKIEHYRNFISTTPGVNNFVTDFSSRVIIAAVRGRLTPTVSGNKSVQFQRFFAYSADPVKAFLREDARQDVDILYDSVFHGSGTFVTLWNQPVSVTGTFGGGGGTIISGTGGTIAANSGSITSTTASNRATYFPVMSSHREVCIDLNDEVVSKQTCQAGQGYPLTTSTQRLSVYYVLWHVTGALPREPANTWQSTLSVETNLIYEDD